MTEEASLSRDVSPVHFRVRRLREEDRSFVQGFNCGSARHHGDVARWITKWIWKERLADRGSETIIAIDTQSGRLIGYGTWSHVNEIGALQTDRLIQVEWFGIDRAYQGATDKDGHSVAGRLFATLEAKARAHPDSAPDMPITLVCHIDNEQGRRFWANRGFQLVPEPFAQVEDDVYNRFVR